MKTATKYGIKIFQGKNFKTLFLQLKGAVARYCAGTAMIGSGDWLTNRNHQKRRPARKRMLRDFEVFAGTSCIPWLKKIIWVIGVLRRTVVIDWRFDNLCGSHLQGQVVVLVSWKFKNPGERFDWSIDRVAVGKYVMWLAVKTCAEIGYANRWIAKWIINKVLLFPVE